MRISIALLGSLAACGHYTAFPNGELDAPPGDTLSPPAADASSSAVTASVTVAGVPAPGVTVYFQSTDGTLVLGATTDANGTVGAELAAGGFVTIIEPADGTGVTRLATFAATQPSDHLHLDLAPVVSSAIPTTMVLTVPMAPGAASYTIATPCGTAALDASATGTIRLVGCGATVDLLVIALDDTGDQLATLYNPNVSLVRPSITLVGSYLPLAATSFTYSNIPPSVVWMATYDAIASLRGRIVDGSTGIAPAGGTAISSLALPVAAGAIAITVSDETPAPSELGEQLVYDWAAETQSYALDVAAARLPPYTSAATYDVASHAITWTQGSGTVAPDLVRARFHADRDGTSWSWAIVGPAASSIAYPQLPVRGFDFNPAAGDTIGVDDLTSIQLPGGYDAARAQGFAAIASYVTGPSGRMVVELPFAPNL